MDRGVFAFFTLVILMVFYLSTGINPETTIVEFDDGSINRSSANIVGVDDQGRGLVVVLEVEVSQGSGDVLINIDNVLFLQDTQESIRSARQSAQEYTRRSNVDYVYSIRTESAVAGGPSAGLPIAVATIAALQNRTIQDGVVMSGTIHPDGRVGRVGEVPKKVEAAAEMGFGKILVPQGQGFTHSDIDVIEVMTVSQAIDKALD